MFSVVAYPPKTVITSLSASEISFYTEQGHSLCFSSVELLSLSEVAMYVLLVAADSVVQEPGRVQSWDRQTARDEQSSWGDDCLDDRRQQVRQVPLQSLQEENQAAQEEGGWRPGRLGHLANDVDKAPWCYRCVSQGSREQKYLALILQIQSLMPCILILKLFVASKIF